MHSEITKQQTTKCDNTINNTNRKRQNVKQRNCDY